jgi:hypothetical protein
MQRSRSPLAERTAPARHVNGPRHSVGARLLASWLRARSLPTPPNHAQDGRRGVPRTCPRHREDSPDHSYGTPPALGRRLATPLIPTTLSSRVGHSPFFRSDCGTHAALPAGARGGHRSFADPGRRSSCGSPVDVLLAGPTGHRFGKTVPVQNSRSSRTCCRRLRAHANARRRPRVLPCPPIATHGEYKRGLTQQTPPLPIERSSAFNSRAFPARWAVGRNAGRAWS